MNSICFGLFVLCILTIAVHGLVGSASGHRWRCLAEPVTAFLAEFDAHSAWFDGTKRFLVQ
jgi:hypothetical protein